MNHLISSPGNLGQFYIHSSTDNLAIHRCIILHGIAPRERQVPDVRGLFPSFSGPSDAVWHQRERIVARAGSKGGLIWYGPCVGRISHHRIIDDHWHTVSELNRLGGKVMKTLGAHDARREDRPGFVKARSIPCEWSQGITMRQEITVNVQIDGRNSEEECCHDE